KSKADRSHILNISLGVLVAILIVLVALLIYFLCTKRRITNDSRRENHITNFKNVGESFMSVESLRIDVAILEIATNNFSEDNKLGQGAFGGYMAPEYIEYGEISTKSDVYSFGVLVLEIISGKKISDRQSELAENLLTLAWMHWSEGLPLELVDTSLGGDSYSSNEIIRCLHLALLCVQGDVEDRPSMLSIVFYLNCSSYLPTPQQPAFLISRRKGLSGLGSTNDFTDKSTKSGSSSGTSGQHSVKSTSRSNNSFSGIESTMY
ncbi:hypothetical protein SOVF_033870, partial [Spinacia oleracea]